MKELFPVFASSFVIALSGAMMPGPLLSATIAKSSKHGIITGPMFIAGHGILEALLLVFLLLGLAPLLRAPLFFSAVSVIGGIIMGITGIQMILGLPALSLQKPARVRSYKSLILTGAMLSIANPYWTVWWATIGLGFILSSRASGIAGVLAFFAGHLLADLLWYTSVSIVIWKGKKLLTDTIYRVIIGVCAAILIGFSLLFLIRGITSYEA